MVFFKLSSFIRVCKEEERKVGKALLLLANQYIKPLQCPYRDQGLNTPNVWEKAVFGS